MTCLLRNSNSMALALYYICFLVAHPLYMGTNIPAFDTSVL